jgi:hypothetical protein
MMFMAFSRHRRPLFGLFFFLLGLGVALYVGTR